MSSFFMRFGTWDAMEKGIILDPEIRAEAIRELGQLTDVVCARDHSSRVYRARLRAMLKIPGMSEAEEEAAHARQMQEALDALKKKA